MRAAIVSILFLAACGSSVVDDDGSGGAGGSGPATGTTTGTGTGATTGAGGGDLLCPEFADVDSPPTVTFRFRNDSGQPIYLTTECGVVDAIIRMGDIPRDDLSFPWIDPCPAHCEQDQRGGPPDCAACAQGVGLLAVGEELVVEWPAAALMATEMPAGCTPDGQALECEQLVDAPADAYQLELLAFSACDGCTCDEQGQCEGAPGGQSMQATFPFDLPTGEVEVLFPVCFFGCAGE